MEKLGIENLKRLLALLIEIGNVADKMGRLTGAARYAPLFELIDELAALGGLVTSQLVPEFKDLDDAEKAELFALVRSKLDLGDDKLEAVIKDGLVLIGKIASDVDEAVKLIKSLKA